jgi:hypothetical protein
MAKIIDRSGIPTPPPILSPFTPKPDFLEVLALSPTGAIYYQKFERQLEIKGSFGNSLNQKDMLMSPQGQQQLGRPITKSLMMVPTRSMSIDSYVEELCQDLKIEYKNEAERKAFEEFIEILGYAITVAAIFQPELLLLKAVGVILDFKSLGDSLENGQVKEFLSVEIMSFFVGTLAKEFMFIAKPKLRIKRKELLVLKLKKEKNDAAFDAVFKEALGKCFYAVESPLQSPAKLSPTTRKLMAIHNFRIENDAAYLVKCKKAQKAIDASSENAAFLKETTVCPF